MQSETKTTVMMMVNSIEYFDSPLCDVFCAVLFCVAASENRADELKYIIMLSVCFCVLPLCR